MDRVQFTNSVTMERPPRRVCGEVIITPEGWLGVCILRPLHGRKGKCLPSPYLGQQ